MLKYNFKRDGDKQVRPLPFACEVMFEKWVQSNCILYAQLPQ